ncbi:MAG: hypothetical protein K2M46_11405 [Lachnospiraceae bacterium]|nr:hypothetical protein [Lachnospiraceae bacterium]
MATTKKTETKKEDVKVTAAEVKADTVKEAPKAEEKKTTAKKTTTKKTTAKKTTASKAETEAKKTTTTRKAAPKKKEVVPKIVLEYKHISVDDAELMERFKEIWIGQMGRTESEIDDLVAYVKPEDYKAYFVVNGIDTVQVFI